MPVLLRPYLPLLPRAATLGALMSVACAAPATAQPAPTACAPRAEMLAVLSDRLGENRRAIGLAGPEAVMELFASDHSGSWTITITLADGRTCLLARGSDFAGIPETAAPTGEGV